jgi:hypothetical protein
MVRVHCCSGAANRPSSGYCVLCAAVCEICSCAAASRLQQHGPLLLACAAVSTCAQQQLQLLHLAMTGNMLLCFCLCSPRLTRAQPQPQGQKPQAQTRSS